jgi:hypothetical protein
VQDASCRNYSEDTLPYRVAGAETVPCNSASLGSSEMETKAFWLTAAEGAVQGPLSWVATAAATLLLVIYIFNFQYGRKRLPGPLFTAPFLGDTIELLRSDPLQFMWKR